MSINYSLWIIEDNALFVEGETGRVFVDAKNGWLRSIPENVINAIEVLPKEKEPGILNRIKII